MTSCKVATLRRYKRYRYVPSDNSSDPHIGHLSVLLHVVSRGFPHLGSFYPPWGMDPGWRSRRRRRRIPGGNEGEGGSHFKASSQVASTLFSGFDFLYRLAKDIVRMDEVMILMMLSAQVFSGVSPRMSLASMLAQRGRQGSPHHFRERAWRQETMGERPA